MNQADADALTRFENAIAKLLAEAMLREIAQAEADRTPEPKETSAAC